MRKAILQSLAKAGVSSSLLESAADEILSLVESKRTGIFSGNSSDAQLNEFHQTSYARSLIEASLDPLFTISAEGNITDVNRATELVTGIAREELIGRSFSNYFTNPADAQAGYLQAFERSSVRDYPLTIRHVSGNLVDVLFNATVFRDSSGIVRGVFASARDITERKKSEEQQKKASHYVRSLIEASLDPLVTISPEGKITDVNNATEKATGVERSALIGSDFSDFFVDRDKAREGYQRVFSDGSVIDYPLAIRKTDGSVVDVLYNASVYRDENGNVLGVFAAARDITERKKAEEQRKKASDYARSLIEASLDPLVTINPSGKIMDVNKATETATGVPREELIGADFSNFFVDPDKAREGYQKVFENGTVIDYALAIRHTSGRVVHVLYNAALYRDADGNVEGVFAAARDITARMIAEEQQRKASKYARSLIEASLDPLVTISPEGKITDVNKATEIATGVPRDELIGADFSNFFVDPDKAREGYQKVFEIGTVLDYPLAIRHRSGRVTDVLYNATIYKDEDDKVLGVFAAARDITERLKTERAMKEALDAAEAGTRAKAAFLANMSHEVRTPIHAVLSLTSLLRETQLDATQLDFVETVYMSSKHLLSITNDILDFSKIDSGKMELEWVPCDLRRCIEETFDLVALKAGEKNLELVYIIDEGTPEYVLCDPGRLRQIIANYLSNATKFTSRGEIVLTLTSRPVPETDCVDPLDGRQRREFRFSVRDTGIGIPSDRLDRLYRSFSQVDVSNTRTYGGTGLGLAIARRLSELMGGHAWAESTVGVGSTFSFTVVIPVISSPRPSELIRTNAQNAELLQKITILVVDDNATSRNVLYSLLCAWGMVVTVVESLEAGMEYLDRGQRFQICLLDDILSSGSSVSAGKQLKHKDPSMVVCLMGCVDRSPARTVDFAGFLPKPIKQSVLASFLSSLINMEVQPQQQQGYNLRKQQQTLMKVDMSVLVADDNPINTKVALRMLERRGYAADVAYNGVEAVRMYEKKKYDCILMDMQMPEMDGLEATRVLRSRWPGVGRPWIIAVTANAMCEDRDRCLAAGMDDYLSKPLDVSTLEQALLRCPAHPLRRIRDSNANSDKSC